MSRRDVFVVSDTHPHPLRRKSHNLFMEMYVKYLRGKETYFVGDCYPGIRYPSHKHFAKLLPYYYRLWDKARAEGRALLGNHEQMDGELPMRIELPGRIFLEHGHRFSIWNNPDSTEWFGDWVVKIIFWLEKKGFPHVAQGPRMIRDFGFKRRALESIKEGDTLVVGHTHFKGDWERGGKRLINLGAYTVWHGFQILRISYDKDGEVCGLKTFTK